MNPTALGTHMDNEFLNQVDEDLNDNSQEPATRGDIRNLALRVELRFTKLESTVDQRFMAIENRFTTIDASIKEYVHKLGWKFFGAIIGAMGVMFTVFAMFITSTLK
jgi:hypothetical protein